MKQILTIICIIKLVVTSQFIEAQTHILLPTPHPGVNAPFPSSGKPYGNPFRIYPSKFKDDVNNRRYLTIRNNGNIVIRGKASNRIEKQIFYPYYDGLQGTRGGRFLALNLFPFFCSSNNNCQFENSIKLVPLPDNTFRIEFQNVCLTLSNDTELRFSPIRNSDDSQKWILEEYAEKDFYYYFKDVKYSCIRQEDFVGGDKIQVIFSNDYGRIESNKIDGVETEESGSFRLTNDAIGIKGDKFKCTLYELDLVDPDDILLERTISMKIGRATINPRGSPPITGYYSLQINLKRGTQR